MKAVIMAGGKGSRLRSVAEDIPKPMFPIMGRPILEFQIESLRKSGITDITLIVGHLGSVIQGYFDNGKKWGVKIDYLFEDRPLGTAGALFYLKHQGINDFFLVFGDLILDIDWERFMEFHKAKGGMITLYGHPNSHPYDSDLIIADPNDKVIKIISKNAKRDRYHHNLVNAGVYCVNARSLESLSKPEKIDLEKKLIADQIVAGTVYVYKSTEYIKDMGTPDRLEEVIDDVKNGIVVRRNLKNKQKAVFLDRDGTINVLHGFLKIAEDLRLLPNVASAIKKLNRSGYLVIVATNQPVIARGECSFMELERIHMKMETELGKEGAYIDALFFCPHHPDKGYAGEIVDLKSECDCRKPRLGMIDRAAERYNIDLTRSWFIGDTTTDIQTGINAGMKTVLVHTGEAGSDKKYDVQPTVEADDLLDAVNKII